MALIGHRPWPTAPAAPPVAARGRRRRNLPLLVGGKGDRMLGLVARYADEWNMWGLPMFDLQDPAAVMYELAECRKVHGGRSYIRLSAFDSTAGWESLRLSILTDRPALEPGFMLERQEAPGRTIRYTTRAYATDRPSGERYG